MDIQLKRGLLDVCVLCALRSGDSYGYQIIKDLSGIVEISESTLYPILKRLESSKLVTVYTAEHNFRLRKYYSITPAGYERINEFISDFSEIRRATDFIERGCQATDGNTNNNKNNAQTEE